MLGLPVSKFNAPTIVACSEDQVAVYDKGNRAVKVFDNASAASGKELSRLILQTPHAGGGEFKPSSAMLEFDMHGVIASNGLYLEISTGAGTGAAISVEFA